MEVNRMLMIRHAIGSRLFFQTDHYQIVQEGNRWHITTVVDEETYVKNLAFKKEINIFDAGDHEKTWYYSSDAQMDYQPVENQLVIYADHKTVYPV
jgi:hypothetical protein